MRAWGRSRIDSRAVAAQEGIEAEDQDGVNAHDRDGGDHPNDSDLPAIWRRFTGPFRATSRL
jgi:hypothetical protein